MAEAAKQALSVDSFHVVADALYLDAEQAARCEAAGTLPQVPVMRTVNNQGDDNIKRMTSLLGAAKLTESLHRT